MDVREGRDMKGTKGKEMGVDVKKRGRKELRCTE